MKDAWQASRGLRHFLVASLGLHLVLLLGLNADRPPIASQAPANPVKAVLSGAGRQVETPVAHTDSSPGGRPLPKPPDAGAERRTKPPLAEVAIATPGGGAAMRPAMPVGIGREAAADVGAQASLPQETASADAVRQYVLLLVPEARRLKRYPGLARERGWEGTAEISVRLGKAQAEPVAAMTRSSGFPVLDEQALAIVGQAVRLVPVPDPLRGKDVSIPVAVRFSLQD